MRYISQRANAPTIKATHYNGYCYEAPTRRPSSMIGNIGGSSLPIVITNGYAEKYADGCTPDYLFINDGNIPSGIDSNKIIVQFTGDQTDYCQLFAW